MDIALDRRKINLIWMFLYSVMAALKISINKATVIPFRRETSNIGARRINAETYMNEYGNIILRLAYSYVHNLDDAEDILQDTFLKIFKANPEFTNEKHEKAYILKVASNVAKDKINENKRHDVDELKNELVAEKREDLSFMWEAVKSLSETEREVIHLFYQEGFRTSEIAYIIGRKEVTVRSDLKRARKHLKQILKEEYDFG